MQTLFNLTEDVTQAIRRKVYIPEGVCGHKFGRYTVIKFSHQTDKNRRFWVVQCECGDQKIIREDYIKLGIAGCAKCRRRELQARKGPRKCSCCQRMLERSCFAKDCHVVDGIARYCKQCSRSKGAKRRAANNLKNTNLEKPNTEKKCGQCGLVKPATEFWFDRTNSDGLCSICGTCKNAAVRRWYAATGRTNRLSKCRTARYGMSPSDLDKMLKEQDNKCPICKSVFASHKSFVIDHDHATGAVRSLLCCACNSGIGMFRDSRSLLQSASEYLAKHSQT